MNSASPTSSPGFNALSPAGPMRYACPSMESIRARLPGGPAKYQVRPVQTKATNNASVAAAKDNLAKLHWKPRAPDSIRQLRSEEHTSELQSRQYLVCRLLLEKKKKRTRY